jgi:DNA-binding NtrC family response regulator
MGMRAESSSITARHPSSQHQSISRAVLMNDRRTRDGLGPLLGRSPVMKEIFRLIERVGPTEAGVLIVGESGCGKELVAELIHAYSSRSQGPFLAINCGAIPANLIEAELFGHEKGSFTGAVQAHAGVFERASGGTLLLDEVTEMPIELQTRLLRVLELKRFRRVGGSHELDTDVRIIAATNRSPMDAVQDGRLREDLLYRLAVFPIHVPPLRDREDDALLLADRFLADLNAMAGTNKRLSSQSSVTLTRHTWPGNVRELKNAIERAFILGDDWLELAPLLAEPPQATATLADAVGHVTDGALQVRVGARIADVERMLIEATLRQLEGNKRRTAAVLGCSLKTLYNKLHAYAREQQCA